MPSTMSVCVCVALHRLAFGLNTASYTSMAGTDAVIGRFDKGAVLPVGEYDVTGTSMAAVKAVKLQTLTGTSLIYEAGSTIVNFTRSLGSHSSVVRTAVLVAPRPCSFFACILSHFQPSDPALSFGRTEGTACVDCVVAALWFSFMCCAFAVALTGVSTPARAARGNTVRFFVCHSLSHMLVSDCAVSIS